MTKILLIPSGIDDVKVNMITNLFFHQWQGMVTCPYKNCANFNTVVANTNKSAFECTFGISHKYPHGTILETSYQAKCRSCGTQTKNPNGIKSLCTHPKILTCVIVPDFCNPQLAPPMTVQSAGVQYNLVAALVRVPDHFYSFVKYDEQWLRIDNKGCSVTVLKSNVLPNITNQSNYGYELLFFAENERKQRARQSQIKRKYGKEEVTGRLKQKVKLKKKRKHNAEEMNQKQQKKRVTRRLKMEEKPGKKRKNSTEEVKQRQKKIKIQLTAKQKEEKRKLVRMAKLIQKTNNLCKVCNMRYNKNSPAEWKGCEYCVPENDIPLERTKAQYWICYECDSSNYGQKQFQKHEQLCKNKRNPKPYKPKTASKKKQNRLVEGMRIKIRWGRTVYAGTLRKYNHKKKAWEVHYDDGTTLFEKAYHIAAPGEQFDE